MTNSIVIFFFLNFIIVQKIKILKTLDSKSTLTINVLKTILQIANTHNYLACEQFKIKLLGYCYFGWAIGLCRDGVKNSHSIDFIYSNLLFNNRFENL